MLKKIGFKLIFVVGLTAITIIGVFAYINIRSQNNDMLGEVERHANQLSETIKKSTRYGMLINQRDYVHEIIQTIGKDPCIGKVRVFNKVGEIIYSSQADDAGKLVDMDTESCYACHAADQPLQRLAIEDRTRIFQEHPDSGRVLGIINPIYNEKSCWEADCHAHPQGQTVLGVLDITFCLKEVDEQIIKSEITILIFAIIAILAIGLIIGIFVKRWVDNPVNELVNATKHVAAGNLNYSVNETSKDELGTLANSFNNMTQKLSEMRMQLFQSDKMASMGRLAAGVAHEINNPLTGVLTYSSFLLKRAKDDPKLKKDLEVIVRETKRSREIVKGLLDFSRQSTPKKRKIAINEIIERSVSIVSNQLTINNIQLVKNLEKELPEIIGDANQIQQVILNLLVNSVDAIESGGRIELNSSLITLEPYGFAQIKQAFCSKNHSLMDNEHRIEGMPSIKVKAYLNSTEGYLNLDPVYGQQRHHYGFSYQENKTVRLTCPECDISLLDENKKCPECGSPVYRIHIPEQGVLEGCSRFGCKWQKWDSVDLSGKQKFIEIKVTDDGCGISENNLEKIFDPFYTTKGQKGTGLGLSVVWGIVDNHDGKIMVKSKEGKGTTFTVRLPAGRA